MYGHSLFAKAVKHGRSILILSDLDNEVDIGAVCTLTRCIMEIQKAASYFLEFNLSKEESNMRLHLLLLNHSSDLGKINDNLGTSGSSSLHKTFRDVHLVGLQKNPIFSSFEDKHQKNLLRGKSPYLHSRYSGSKVLPLNIESGLYTLFSQSVHSFSLGLTDLVDGSASPAGAYNSYMLAIEATSLYLASFALSYLRVRHRTFKDFPSRKRIALENLATPESLMKHLQEIKMKHCGW
jgi:hypothetical protein